MDTNLYLYQSVMKLLNAAGYSISRTSDDKYMVNTGSSGIYFQADTLTEAVEFCVGHAEIRIREDRLELGRRIMIELGVPPEIIK